MSERSSVLQIDLNALAGNLSAIRQFIGADCDVCAVIKADAYGLGIGPIARTLGQHGAALLAVYNVQQAEQLIQCSIETDVLILMPVDDVPRDGALGQALAAGRMMLTVHSVAHLAMVKQIADVLDRVIPVHIEVDTGMSRAGADLHEFSTIVEDIDVDRRVRLAGIFTHPSSADEDADVTEQQWDKFEWELQAHANHIGPDVLIHFANSPAMLRSPRYHQRMVRIGLSLLGYAEEDMTGPTETTPLPSLRPIVRWTSHIVHVRDVPAGTPVGYNRRFVTQRPSRLGLVPVGYADGYRRALSNRAVVRIGDALVPAPVRGLVSMDQIVVDLTEVPEAQVGTSAELISNDPLAPNALHRLAAMADTISYEVLCGLSHRLPRVYVDEPGGGAHS